MKATIKIEEFWEHVNWLRALNMMPLEDIQFELYGELKEIPEHVLTNWKQIGLLNEDLINSNFLDGYGIKWHRFPYK